jgi:hypothetical protein
MGRVRTAAGNENESRFFREQQQMNRELALAFRLLIRIRCWSANAKGTWGGKNEDARCGSFVYKVLSGLQKEIRSNERLLLHTHIHVCVCVW